MEDLERAARAFVAAASQLEGGLFSARYRSSREPLTLTLVERFADQTALDRHMQAASFHQFQVVRGPLLRQPAEAVVLDRLPVDFRR